MSPLGERRVRQDRLVLEALSYDVACETKDVAIAVSMKIGEARSALLRLQAAGNVEHIDATGEGLPWGWRRVR